MSEIQLEIDGKKVTATKGMTVLEAAFVLTQSLAFPWYSRRPV